MSTSEESLRLFLAVRAKERAVAAAWEFKQRFATHLPRARWTHPEDLHVTLKFFGRTSLSEKGQLEASIAILCRETAPFSLGFSGVDFFSSRGKPHILWGRVIEGREELGRFVARLDEFLKAHGLVPEERPYQPHLTLARLSTGLSRDIQEKTRLGPFAAESTLITHIELMASDLSAPPHAPRYRAISIFSLEGTPFATGAKEQP